MVGRQERMAADLSRILPHCGTTFDAARVPHRNSSAASVASLPLMRHRFIRCTLSTPVITNALAIAIPLGKGCEQADSVLGRFQSARVDADPYALLAGFSS